MSKSLQKIRKMLYHSSGTLNHLQQNFRNDLMTIANGQDKCREIRSKISVNNSDKFNNLIEMLRIFCPDNRLLEDINDIDANQLVYIIDSIGVALARYVYL